MSTSSSLQPEEDPLEDFDSASLPALPAADLVAESYPGLYRLAFAGLESHENAHTAAVRVLAAAWLSPAMRIGGGRLWVFNLLLKEVEQLPRTRPAHSPPSDLASDEYQSAFQRLVDGWDAMEARLAALHYLMGWPVSEIAALLKVGAAAVEAQIEIFRRQFTGLPRPSPAVDSLPPTLRIPDPSAAAIPLSPAERPAVDALHRRWPLPVLSREEVDRIAAEVEQAAVMPRRRFSISPRMFSIGAVLLALICLLAFAAAGPAVFGSSGLLPRATATPTIPGFPTTFPTVESVNALNRRFTSEEILQRWEQNPNLWHSLTLDTQIVDYGPENYIGPARRYRAQGWVLQPNQGIELFGLPGQPPGRVYLAGGGRSFLRSYADDRTDSWEWSGESGDLLYDPTLRSMVFPHTSTWAQREGSFWWVENDRLLDRPVIVFDWLNHLNQRQARLWLDAQTGILLRLQEYDGEQFERIRRESLVTDLAFERVEPPPELLVAARQSQESNAAPPGFQAIVETPTPAITVTPPAPLVSDPAPAGMDPSRSRLIFQFPADQENTESSLNASGVEAELFADVYSLGPVRFSPPWGLRCRRSRDGSRIAFNTTSDGAAASDETLRWFNLNRPDQVYRLASGLQAADFTFSPDGASMAAAGFDETSQVEGVFLVDIATGEYELLLEAADARSLTFSPDGEFLALIVRLPNERLPVIITLHVDTQQIASKGEPGIIDSTPAGSGIGEWGITFPVSMGGMESCALP